MKARYFSKETDPKLFYCSYDGSEGLQEHFLKALDTLRKNCGFPFVITSGYRSRNHPVERRKVKGGPHNQGIAADIAVRDGVQRRKIVEEAIKLGFGGIGIHKDFVHVDLRETVPVMWEYS